MEAVVLDVAQGPQDLSCACELPCGAPSVLRSLVFFSAPAAIAFFAIKMQTVAGDDMLGLAIWDYLGTCMSAILSGSHLCEDKPLALIVSSLICHALSGLMAGNVVVGACQAVLASA